MKIFVVFSLKILVSWATFNSKNPSKLFKKLKSASKWQRQKVDKTGQTKDWPKMKVRWHFAPIFPGVKANYSSLMPWTKSRDAMLARHYNSASCQRQLIGNIRQQVGKGRTEVSPNFEKCPAIHLAWFNQRLNQMPMWCKILFQILK